jgi:hypothetical protein
MEHDVDLGDRLRGDSVAREQALAVAEPPASRFS